jgi:ABC-type antimicrobial peptide transport system ATPase subunit
LSHVDIFGALITHTQKIQVSAGRARSLREMIAEGLREAWRVTIDRVRHDGQRVAMLVLAAEGRRLTFRQPSGTCAA